ncbi:MAG: hypothetical protein RR385_09810 [Clostridiales bacterium]
MTKPINDQMIAVYGKGNKNYTCGKCWYYQRKTCLLSHPKKPKLVSAWGQSCGKLLIKE